MINKAEPQLNLRVSSGTAKNKKLITPQIEGFRAVQEIAKQAVFSIIGDKIENAICLDLFAGSGNLGIEALSRGAKWCDFVDSHMISIETIKENLQNCGFTSNSKCFSKDCVKFLTQITDIKSAEPSDRLIQKDVVSTILDNTQHTKYDVVFIDPFYSNHQLTHFFKLLFELTQIHEPDFIFYFHEKGFDPSEILGKTGFKIYDSRTFGQSQFDLLVLAGN